MRRRVFHGFGLLEFLFAVGILALISVIIIKGLNSFRQERQLDVVTETIVFELAKARNMTKLSEGGLQYGLRLNATSVERFIGDTYSVASSTRIDFDDAVEIIGVTLELGGKDVLYDRITGETADYGTATVRLVNYPSSTRLLTISPFGLVDVD